MKFDKIIDYRNITNQSNDPKRNVKPLRKELENLLKKSALSDQINVMSKEDKSNLILAIISGNGIELQKLLTQKNLIERMVQLVNLNIEGDFQTYDFQRLLESNNNKKYLNSVAIAFIQSILHSIPVQADRTNLLKDIMKSCPEEVIVLKAKKSMLFEIDTFSAKAITDPAYDEQSKPIETIHHQKINLAKIKSILSKHQMDKSQFIHLTRGLLRECLNKDEKLTKKILDHIDNLYLNLEYDKCVSFIVKYISTKDLPLKDEVNVAAVKLLPIDIKKNHERRYFETKLAQSYLGMQLPLQVKSVNKITSYFYKEKKLGIELDLSNPAVSTESAISSITDSSKVLGAVARMRESHLKRSSDLYPKKGRGYRFPTRKDFTRLKTKEKSHDSKKEEEKFILSRQMGIMKSTSPFYMDELTQNNLINRSADVHTFSLDPTDWPLSHPEIPFVGSLSGHFYYIIGILEYYMKEHAKDPELSRDINAFLTATLAVYVKQGFHSLYEMITILKEPHVQQFFKNHKVNVDISFSPEIIANAAEYGTTYTIDHSYKKLLNQQISSASIFLKETKKEKKEIQMEPQREAYKRK